MRYILGQGNKILARSAFTVKAVGASVKGPASTAAGAKFQVQWQGPSSEGDYITVAAAGSPAGQYDNYAYTRAGNPAKLTAPAEPGNYEMRYILGQGDKLLAKSPISVTAVSATVSAPAETAAEADFQVAWQGPAYEGDYVTIVAPDAGNSEYMSYFYTAKGTPGTLTAPRQTGRLRGALRHG